MNDQTSPTADGQLPDPTADHFAALRDADGFAPDSTADPFATPRDADGLTPVPTGDPFAAPRDAVGLAPVSTADPFATPRDADGLAPVPQPSPETLTGGRTGVSLSSLLKQWRPDITAALALVVTGAVIGVLSGVAWYRFSPTVWLSLPASAVSQVTDGVDQSSLLVAPEAKGIVSVDGYYFVICAIGGLLLGALAYLLARRGEVRGGDQQDTGGAGVGSWAGVLLGGFAASTVTAALGRWISLPDPLTVLHAVAGGHNFHAPVALHSTGLYVVTPLFGMVLYLALTAAFTKAPPQEWETFVERGGYFSQDNPYGFATPPATPPALASPNPPSPNPPPPAKPS